MLEAVIEKRAELPALKSIPLPQAQRPLARALASSALRHFGQLTQALRQCLARPDAQSKALALIHFHLLIAAAELIFLQRKPHPAVFLGVEAVRRKEPNLTKFANALLRQIERQRVALAEADPISNAPDWMAKRWQQQWGEARCRALAQAHAAPPARLSLSCKTLETTKAYAARLDAELVQSGSMVLPQLLLASGAPVETLAGWREGDWWVQSQAAAWPARFLGDVRARRVLDFCAAPGGKAAQLASAGAKLTAFEPDETRRARLQENFARLGLKAGFPKSLTALKTQCPPEGFDAILVDAPCMGTGTLNRHPDLAYIRRPSDLPRLVRLQKQLLQQACAMLKKGGVLVYAVCSLEAEEGEEQIADFLAAHPAMRLDWIKNEELGGVRGLLKEGQFRIWPCQNSKGGSMDGFYAARLIRQKNL